MPSVVVTVLLALSILGGIGWSLTGQLVTLADELPRYSLNIHHRIADLRGVGKGGSVEKVQKTVEDVAGEIQKTDPQGVTREKPIAVFRGTRSSGSWSVVGSHDERDTDRQHLLAAGADHVEMTVVGTQRTLAQTGLTLRRPAPESPPTPVPEVVL